MSKIAACLLFLLAVLWMPQDSPGQTKWFLLSCLSAVLIGQKLIRPKLGLPAALLFMYCLINGAWFWIFKHNRYFPVNAYEQQAIRFYTSDGIAKLLLVFTPLALFLNNREKLGEYGGKLAATFCALNTTLVYFSFFFEPNWCRTINSCGGSLSNPSMNSTMIVVTLPFLIALTGGIFRWANIALVVGAVFLSKGSVGVGMLAALACLYALKFGHWKLLLPAPLFLAAGSYFYGAAMFNTGERFKMWSFFMSRWARYPENYLFGTGYGNFGVHSANLQISEGQTVNWWIWLHNDWLEILFTLGVVGLALSLTVYLSALYRLYVQGRQVEAISLILFGLAMAMNWPLHHPLGAAMGAFLIVFGLLRSPNKNSETGVLSWHNC